MYNVHLAVVCATPWSLAPVGKALLDVVEVEIHAAGSSSAGGFFWLSPQDSPRVPAPSGT